MSTSARAPLAPPPEGWETRFGPLSLVGAHAGVAVWRGQDDGATVFLKRLDEPARAAREAAALRAGLPLRAPRLLEHDEGLGALVLADARLGAARPRRLTADQALAAAPLLAKLHAHAVPDTTPASAWDHRVRRLADDPRLPEPLRERLRDVVCFGDAFCHGDLHPSNWLLSPDGSPEGLLDWSSSGMMDPEWDVAGLWGAAGGLAELPAPLILAYEAAADRPIDAGRVTLYRLVQLFEGLGAKDAETAAPLRVQAEALLATLPSLPPLHGAQRVPRSVPKPPESVLADGSNLRWAEPAGPIPRVLNTLLSPHALGQAPDSPPLTFAQHACNDVLRLSIGGERLILKVYNKPVAPTLFVLEERLSQHITAPARVLGPKRLRSGGGLMRVDGRPAALYADVGDARLSQRPADLTRLAETLAALHAVPEDVARVDGLPPNYDVFERQLVLTTVHDALHPDERAQLAALSAEMNQREDSLRPETLPHALLHGALHRDHTALDEQGRVVIFDLEKARWGPRLLDLSRAAYLAGYRTNDEALSPEKIVHFVRSYHRRLPLTDAERALLLPLLLSACLHDLKSLHQEGWAVGPLLRHARLTLELAHNREALDAAIQRYTGPGA
ncbi:MAG: phosphotransferase [Deltaproteobacteria bacterium]|nr:phosphotransferase [Deltaproteobacteria bacterium]